MGMHNNGKHIETIVDETVCTKHSADQGRACWPIENRTDSCRPGMAVCGSRISLYGFNGRISEQSTQTRREKVARTRPAPR